MKKLKINRYLTALAVVLALMLATSAIVYAATGTVQITGGSLSVTPASVTLTTTTLTGAELAATSAYTANAWTANDPTGTGAGWNVTIISTDFGSPTNEKQTVTITGTPTGGTFTLTYSGQTTGSIAYNAAASAVDTALEALTNIEAVTVTGGPLPGTAVVVEFTNPGNQDVALMTATATLTGGTSPAVTVTLTTAGAPGIDIDVSDQYFKIQILDTNITVINGSAIKPTSAVTSLTTIPFTGAAVLKIVTAGVNTGMGNYNIPPAFELLIPAETYAGTYTAATITVGVNSRTQDIAPTR